MAAVGFEPMTLGFWVFVPTHCAIDADNVNSYILKQFFFLNISDIYYEVDITEYVIH